MEKVNAHQKRFGIRESTVIKGVAVLLLLIHHVFNSKYSYTSIIPEDIMLNIVSLAKICVAMFFIISGYGMFKSYVKCKEEGCSDLKFIYKHIVNVLLTFWLIYLIFVPLGVLFDRSPSFVYGDHIFINFLIDFGGGANILGTPSMNNTWWYLDFTIIFYLISPILFKTVIYLNRKSVFCFSALAFFSLFFYGFRGIVIYFIPYFLGVITSQFDIFEKMNTFKNNKFILMTFTIIMIFVIWIRQCFLLNDAKFYKLDWIIAFILIYLIFHFIKKEGNTFKLLYGLGKHSAYIFYFHSFIYSYYFCDMLYSLRYASLIYIIMLLACISISFLIMRIHKFVKKIIISSLDATNYRTYKVIFFKWILIMFMGSAPYLVANFSIGDIKIITEPIDLQVGCSRRIIIENETLFNDYSKIRWISKNPEIASISNDGVITAHKEGKAEFVLINGLYEYSYSLSIVNK